MGRDRGRSGGLNRVRREVAIWVSFVVLVAGMVAALSTRGDRLLLLVTLVVAVFAVLVTVRLRALELILAAMGLGLIIDAFAVDGGAADAPDHIIIGVAALFSVVVVRCRPWLARTASAAASAIAHRLQASALAANSPLGMASPADSEAEAAMNGGAISRLPTSQLLTGLGIPLSRLSQRQQEVVALVIQGLSAREIGARLFISERTVETHLANVYERLDIHSRHELILSHGRVGLSLFGRFGAGQASPEAQ